MIQNMQKKPSQISQSNPSLKMTDFVIQYTTSIVALETQQNNQMDQSIPLQSQPIIYNIKKDKSKEEQNLLIQSFVHVNVQNGEDDCNKQQCGNEGSEGEGANQCNNLSTIPQHFTVSKIHKVNEVQQYQSVRSEDNFLVRQIFYQPIEIVLPQVVKEQVKNYQILDVLIPCTFVQIHTKSQQKKNTSFINSKLQKNQQTSPKYQNKITQPKHHPKDMSQSKFQQKQKTKIITDVLLDKISQLETKIKALEQQKKMTQQLNKAASQYQSTPHLQPVANFGSIKKNDITKKFSTVAQTQQTNFSQFRLRHVGARSMSSSENKIHSNLYNIMFVQNKQDNSVKQQIELLKRKLHALENAHIFQDKTIKNSIREQNFKFFENKPQQKLCTPSRRQLGGKIVKRSGSKISNSPENTYRTNTQESMVLDAQKGFIRSGPHKFVSAQDSNISQMTKYSNVYDHEGQQSRKKGDSSAIFRKNLGPAIIQKKQISSTQFSKAKTLQFNPSQQKFIVLDSRQTESNFKNQSFSPILQQYTTQIFIPNLNPYPTPNSSSDQLIQIGKLTFKKFGCQVNQNVILNVKKFKNCVLFSLGVQQNILWHYEGRFYHGGWKIYANGQGQKYGKGIQYVPGKYKYKGTFQDGKRSGHGMLIGENGSIYIGNWFDGLKHGKGKLTQSDGSQYQGEWKSGKKSGNGKIFYKGTLQFQGNFVGGMKNGFGKQKFQNGDYYEGQYLNNKFQGKGTYIWASKAVYTGQFRDGKRHGYGIWKSGQNNCDTYQGQYKQDNKNGYGVYKWANGAIYKGKFENDLKHGEGTITYQNGKVVHMVWNKGNMEKTLSNSKLEQTQSKSQHYNQDPKTKLRKSSSTRANLNLQSAKSLKSQRSLPKGMNVKKQTQYNQVQPSPKVQFRTKVNQTDLIKFKIGSENSSRLISKQSGNPIKDPPYKSMQTSSNINMNI